jgi:hypothetical protein
MLHTTARSTEPLVAHELALLLPASSLHESLDDPSARASARTLHPLLSLDISMKIAALSEDTNDWKYSSPSPAISPWAL